MPQIQEFLLSLLKHKEGQKLVGRKRIHKTIQLMRYAGIDIEANFRILHYGPYSYEVADAIDELLVSGQVIEKEELVHRFFQSTFTLRDQSSSVVDLDEREQKLFDAIDARSTLILEIASTLAFYKNERGSRKEAVQETKNLKPAKATSYVLQKAEELLKELQNI